MTALVPTKTKLLEDFLRDEKREGKRMQTLKGYRRRVPRFLNFLEEQQVELSTLSFRDALAYQGALLASRNRKKEEVGLLTRRTAASYLYSASRFCSYLKKKGHLFTNPFREIPQPRSEKKLPRNILREKTMNDFLEQLARFDEETSLKRQMMRYKVHVLSELQYASGLRISEAAALRTEDLDLERGLVKVQDGKGGFSRTAFLNSYTIEILRIYIHLMRPLLITQKNRHNQELLFLSQTDWLEKQSNTCLKEEARKLGLEGMTTHGFRHALGFHLLRSGCGIRYIQSILGHKSLKNTEIYTQVDKTDLKQVLDDFHPRGSWRRRE